MILNDKYKKLTHVESPEAKLEPAAAPLLSPPARARVLSLVMALPPSALLPC